MSRPWLAVPLLLVSQVIARADPDQTRPSATVPVTFLGKHGYRVLVGRQFCAAPCVLDLAPGPAHLYVVGDGARGGMGSQFEEDIVVPAAPATVEIDTMYRRRRWAGVALLFASLPMAIAGVVMFSLDGHVATQRTPSTPVFPILGGVYAGLGALFAVAGTVLIATDHARRLELTITDRAALRPRFAGAHLGFTASSAAAALSFTF